MKRPSESIVFRSLCGIVLLLAVFAVVINAIGYKVFTDALLAQYADGAFRTADTAAYYVDSDRMDAYWASGGEGEEYEVAWENLSRLCNSSGATFVYVIEPDISDYQHIRFLFSTINENSPYDLYEFGYLRETTNEEYAQKYRSSGRVIRSRSWSSVTRATSRPIPISPPCVRSGIRAARP